MVKYLPRKKKNADTLLINKIEGPKGQEEPLCSQINKTVISAGLAILKDVLQYTSETSVSGSLDVLIELTLL